MKRTYDPRRIKRNRSYTVQRLAKLYGVQPNTVRQWIKKHGLPVLEGSYPTLMHWQDIRDWMTAWQAARKWTCAPDEMSCFSCQGPRKVKAGTFRIEASNKNTFMLHGQCETCDGPMNRSSSQSKIRVDRANFMPITAPHCAPIIAHNSNADSPLNPSL